MSNLDNFMFHHCFFYLHYGNKHFQQVKIKNVIVKIIPGGDVRGIFDRLARGIAAVGEVVKEESGKNQTLHTLKCHPTSEIPTEPGTIPMECQDLATSIEPIIVILSSEGLDLDYISKKNIKVVVKEFMLMDMQQQQTTMTTQQTPKRKK